MGATAWPTILTRVRIALCAGVAAAFVRVVTSRNRARRHNARGSSYRQIESSSALCGSKETTTLTTGKVVRDIALWVFAGLTLLLMTAWASLNAFTQ